MLLAFFLTTISLLRLRTRTTTCASGTLQRSTSASDTSCFHSGDRDTTQASNPARHQQRSVSNLHPTAPPARNKKPPKKNNHSIHGRQIADSPALTALYLTVVLPNQRAHKRHHGS